MVSVSRTSHLSASDWAVADALRNWRVRGSGPRALKPISPTTREAGPWKPGPGSGPPRFALRVFSGAGTAFPPNSRCFARQLCVARSRSSWGCCGLGPAGVAVAAATERAFPPPRRRRTQGFDVRSPASHPVRFYVTFRRFNNLFTICACALLKLSFVSMETGPSPTPPSHLFL